MNFEHIFPNEKCVIAVSGGKDSMALCHYILTNFGNDNFVVVHVNHNINPLSRTWAENIKSYFNDNFNMEVIIENVYVDTSSSIEENARIERYNALKKHGSNIIIAHHLGDVFETMTMRMVRGQECQSPKPVHDFGDFVVYRPILYTTQESIIDYCMENNIIWDEDPSNIDISYERNYIRNVITPVFKNKYNDFHIGYGKIHKEMIEGRELADDLAEIDLENIKIDNHLCLKKLSVFPRRRIKNVIKKILRDNNIFGCRSSNLDNFISYIMNYDHNNNTVFSCSGRIVFKQKGNKLFIKV